MDDIAKKLLQKILKDNGYSVTTARQFVCELLWNREPQSMHELMQRLDGKIDRASLYRTLGLFEQLGLAHRVYIGWKYKVELSDMFTHHHHHLSCLSCGKVVAITEDEKAERLIRALATRQGFSVQSHQLEIQGLCADCLVKPAKSGLPVAIG
jgi:Fur family ferric uptake transcriptional regulator